MLWFRSKKRKPSPAGKPVEDVPVPSLDPARYAAEVSPLLRSPYNVVALLVAAMDRFIDDRIGCLRQIQALKGPTPLEPREVAAIRACLIGRPYQPRSYFVGAEPTNGYVPEQPLRVRFDRNPAALAGGDIVRLQVHCAGEALPRPVSLRRYGSHYYLWDYDSMLLSVPYPREEAEEPHCFWEDDPPSDPNQDGERRIKGVKHMPEFPIGCWTYHSMADIYPGMVRDWHDLGLTNPMTPVFEPGDSKADMLSLLDECDRYGMKVFVWDARCLWRELTQKGEAAFRAGVAAAVEDFGTHPANKGFYIGDEPDAPDAADAFAAARIVREAAPELSPYLNLLPWFDWIGERIGSPAYAPYLDRAAKEGDLKLLAYDCYTQMWDGDKGWDVYFDNLREHSEAARRNGIEYCSTLLSMGHYDYRPPNIDDFRWQVSTAAACGAKSIAWFYVRQTAPHANYRQPAINAWNERSSTFEWLSSANRTFQHQFGAEMLRLQVQDIRFTVKAYGGCRLFEADADLLDAENSKGLPMLISRFADADGRKYWAVVNLDNTRSVTANLHLAPDAVLEMKAFDGDWDKISAITDAVGKQAYGSGASTASLILAPGQMELIRLQRI